MKDFAVQWFQTGWILGSVLAFAVGVYAGNTSKRWLGWLNVAFWLVVGFVMLAAKHS